MLVQPRSPLSTNLNAVRLVFFGSFRIERDAQPIHLPRRKVEALLAYLVLHPEPHSREKLAALFWGDFSDAQARASLRNALAVLRKEFGDDLLLTDRDLVQINPGTCLAFNAERCRPQVPKSRERASIGQWTSDGKGTTVNEMGNPDNVLRPSPDARDGRLAELESQLRQRDALIAQLQQRLAELEQRLAELERAAQRQATPFARKRRKENPKRPGRKAGQGRFPFRSRPPPDQVAETKAQPLDACPTCGGPVTDVKDHEQFVVDLPEVRPTVTRYVTQSGHCAQCGRRVRSRHPEQISEASGAAGVLIGPRAKALAADLKHRLGVPYGKVAEVLEVGFGLPVSRGGLCQADARLAKQARPVYAELLDLIRQSAVAHVDETGWRLGTLAAWLWVFTNRDLTVYTIARGRGHEVVVAILGEAFTGVLVSDCFTAHDHQALATWLKQKCVGHLLKDLSDLNERKTGGAVRFAREVTGVLRAALQLRDRKRALAPADFAAQAAQLEARLDALIDTRRQLTDADNARFAKRLRKHREHLLRFLYVDGLDATNN